MNRDQWLKKLEKELKKLPQEEREEALVYYREYLEEIPEEQWEESSKQLGSPGRVAAQIKGDYAINRLEHQGEKDHQKGQKTTTKIWLILLAVFGGIMAAPVAIPVAIALVAVAGSLVVGVFALVLGVLVSFIALAGSGIVVFITGIALLGQDLAGAVMVIGISLMMMALGTLAFMGTVKGIAALITVMGRRLKVRKDRKKAEAALKEEKSLEGKRGRDNE